MAWFAHQTSSSWRWSSIPVVNGLSDYSHPCQAIADVDHSGAFEGRSA
jgi:ornithine carbamoyltransferase